MPTRLSEVLGLTREDLENKGVYDSMVDYDSTLHIDPALLPKCTIPEFSGATKKITNYFTEVLSLLKASKKEGDAFWRAALRKMTFGEGLNTGLGYAQKGTSGSGIGPETAERVIRTIKEIVDAGTENPAIFELVPIFEGRIGPDMISDMTSMILKDDFLAFTNRIAGELDIKVPLDAKGRPIVFVPKILLSDLPTAEQWESVSIAAAYNEEVRSSLNALIGKSWKEFANATSKQERREMLIKHPELLKELLRLYGKRGGKEYDFILDHFGIMLWDVVGPEAAEAAPLDLTKFSTVTKDNILEVVLTICEQYKKLIEHNGLVEHLYDTNKQRRPERFPQLLFFAIADSYCQANDLDLSREINAGSGALDFKVSHGLAKVTVEIKYTSNPKLVEGYEKQLPTYNKAEGVEDKYSVYLILKVNKRSTLKLKKIADMKRENERLHGAAPELVIVDAIKKPSASKR